MALRNVNALEQIQLQSQVLCQTLSTQQIQYLKLLAMNTLELDKYLNELNLENPVIEIEPQQTDLEQILSPYELAQWISSANKQASAFPDSNYATISSESAEPADSGQNNLQEFLASQFDLSLSDADISLLNGLICSLDEHGFLTCPTAQLALQLGAKENEIIEAVSYLQTLDPPGIAAFNVAHSLLLQLERCGVSDPDAQKIIACHLSDLACGHFQKIASVLGISQSRVLELYSIIKGLNPHPAASFGGTHPVYIIPDIYIIEDNGELICTFNRYYCKGISVNKNYLQLADSDPDAKQYINRKLSQAMWIARAVESRRQTIERIVYFIINRQNSFFAHCNGALAPMKMKDIAEDMGIHESTVSRAINDKFLQCKRGIFPLKFFFSGAVCSTSENEAVSSHSIKELIQALIANEDKNSPLSDSELASILSSKGIALARRTVAKYRNLLGIASSSIRGR